MSYELSGKIRGFEPYEPICGEFRSRLDANESFIVPDDELMAKIAEKITSAQLNRYPDPYAKEVCALFADYCGIGTENVVAGNGSDEIISVLMSSFFEKGDKILTFSPDFSMYGFYTQIYELENVKVKKGADFRVDIDAACDLINEHKTRGVILSNPCNPTSIGLPSAEIIKLVERTDALVVIDEAYMEFYGDSVTGRLNEFDNLVVLKTCSKAFGLAGIRLGFALSNVEIINAFKAAKSPYNVNMLTQLAAVAALSDMGKIKRNIDKIIEARDFLYRTVIEFAGENKIISCVYPTNTNFVFMKSAESSRIYNEAKKNGIAIRLMGEYLRVTAGTESETNEFLKVLTMMTREDAK